MTVAAYNVRRRLPDRDLQEDRANFGTIQEVHFSRLYPCPYELGRFRTCLHRRRVWCFVLRPSLRTTSSASPSAPRGAVGGGGARFHPALKCCRFDHERYAFRFGHLTCDVSSGDVFAVFRRILFTEGYR